MKITNYTKENGLKIYTLENENKIIAQSTNINLILIKKQNLIKQNKTN